MKKNLKLKMSALLVIIIIAALFYVVTPLKLLGIGAGYKAKVSCSGIFVSGRDLPSLEKEEFSVNPIFKLISVYPDNDKKIVETSLLGLIKRKAVFRDNLGCTLENNLPVTENPVSAEINKSRELIKEYNLSPYSFTDEKQKTDINTIVNDLFSENSMGRKKNTHAVLVLKNGKVVAEKYAPGFSQNSLIHGWSMSKSANNALVGIRIAQNRLDLKAKNLLLEWEDDDRKNISLDSLMRMSSGLQFNEDYGAISDVTRMLFLTDDTAKYAIRMPLNKEMEGVWSYSSGTTNIISQILRNSFKEDSEYYLFPYKELFAKLGMKNSLIETDASGNFVASSYMLASARDWAKLGLLFLRDGVWEGKRILPEGWVKYSTTPTPRAEKGGYGAQFWLNQAPQGGENKWPALPADLYYMSGYEGQYVFIVPSEQLIIVRLGQTKDSDVLKIDDFVAKIIQSLKAN